MAKTIHFKVTDELYYKLVSLKAQTHVDTWEGLMKHITQPQQPNSPQPQQPKHTEQPKEPELIINPELTKQPIKPEQPINPNRSLDTKNQNNQK